MKKHFYLLAIILLTITKTAFAQAPTITSFTPASGSIGTLVTIIGTNLNNLDTIKIGGVSAIKISAKTDTLVAMVMPGAITGNIYLKNSSGNVTSGSNFTKIASVPPAQQQGSKLFGTSWLGTYVQQGSSVSISADGNTAIVGGSGDNGGIGAAWIYTLSGGIWSQQGSKLVGTGSIGLANQGRSVSISADGNTVIVGGYNDNSNQGAVWVFTRNAGAWTQQGNKLVGTGSVGTTIGQGISVSISADGNTAVVGGNGDNSGQGAIWVFTRSGGVWTQQGNKLVGTGNVGNAKQGKSVNISANGNTIIVGGDFDNSNLGAAWIYIRNSGIWTQQGNKLVGTGNIGTNNQGTSVCLSADGNTAIISGPFDSINRGAVWVFTRNGSIWSQQGNKLVGTGSVGANIYQGISVSISADGNTSIVGGYFDNSSQGATWVYTRSGGVWSQQGSKLVGNGNTDPARQGFSVSLSANGNTAIVGGPNDFGGSLRGAAWVFKDALSQNTNLNALTISSGTLTPVFSSNITAYSATTAATNITITPTKADSNATIQIRINGGNFNLVNSGTPTSLALNLVSNNIDVKVIAQDLITFKIYNLTVISTPLMPIITSFTPNTGYIGTLVTILGNNLSNIDTIKIGGVSAIKIKTKTDTLVAMVMPGAITGNIYITNGSVNTTSSNIFTKVNSTSPSTQQGNKLVGTGNLGPALQGFSVSLSADGNTAIVGGPNDAGIIGLVGAVWIYSRIGNTWVQQGGKLVGSTAINFQPRQGWSVAMSADGNTAIVGGAQDFSGFGAAWVFSRNGGVWSQQGNKLVGSGAVFNASQGSSVSISADGNTVLIGGPDDYNGRGAAWVYTRSGGLWTQQGNKLVGIGISGSIQQGYSVSLSADGNTAMVGGLYDNDSQGVVFFYTRSNGFWSQQNSILVGLSNTYYNAQGISVSLSADGNTCLVGIGSDSNDCGAVWIYSRNNGLWSQQGNKLVGTGNIGAARQGISVSLSADGNTAIVGGPGDNSNQGAAWVYTRSAGVWSQQGSKRVGTGNVGAAKQGCSVSISADGNTAIIGGIGDSSSQGAVWVFTKSSNANLANIILNNSILSQAFNKDSLLYFTTLSNSITNFTVTPFKADSFANIQIKLNNGNYVAINSGTASNPLLLNVGINTVNIKVTAQDGTTIKIYTITINSLPSTNAKLSNINLIGTPYLPIFHSDTLAYSANLLFAVNNARVSSVLSDTSARIKMNSGVFTNINNRDTSALLPLNVGVNTIAIKVTAQDTNVTRTYFINITRAAAVAPSAMSYASPTIIATRTITNINNSVTYSGDSITGFSISPALPTGVSLNTLTGRISGTPTVVFPQTVFTITGINSSGSTTANFTLTVNRIAPSNLKYADSIVIANRTITNINSSVTYSGDSIASFSISPSLPTGVSLNTTTGLISGIPTVTLPQTIFTITGTNNGGSTTASFKLTVNRIAPSNLKYSDSIVIATRTITNINSSVTYSGDSIASFSITPSLPNGVSLNTLTGRISGIPTVVFPQTVFTITGINSSGSTTANFTLTVNRIAPSNLKYTDSIVIATRTITNINSSVTYSGDSITSFSIFPSLPNGVSLNTTTGLISGTPTVTLPQTIFTITGTNNGGSTTASFRLTVNRIAPTNLKYNDSIVVATRTTTNINSSVTYSGDSITSFSITPALPTGVSLNTTTGLISGTPTVNLQQTVFTITGSNSSGNTTASFTLTVNPALAIQEVNNVFSNINCKPNPFNNILEISFESNTKETTKLIILDAVGKEVFAKNIQSIIGENTITVNELTHLKSGIYFARLANNSGLSQAFKLVKE